MAKVVGINIELNLDDGTFTSGMVRAGGAVDTFTGKLQAASGATAEAEGKMTSFAGMMVQATAVAFGMAEAFKAIKEVLYELPKQIVETTGELQKMTTMFTGLSQQLSEQGRKEEATAWVKSIYEMAQKTPFAVNELSKSFVMMKSVGIDPLNGSLKAVTDALSQFGGSDEQLQHATLAIMEMAGRGVVSLEQLRRQLGKAIPTAIQDMAFSMNVTYGELMAAVQKGTLESTTALAKMLEEMKIVYAGQGLQHMQNFIGQTQVFRTEWAIFQQDIGKAGFMDAVQVEFQKIIDLLKTPAAATFAASYGQMLAEIVQGLDKAVQVVIDFHGEIQRAGEALLLYFAGTKLTAVLGGFAQQIMSLGGVIRGTLTAAVNTYYAAANQALNVTQYWNAGGMQMAQAAGVAAGAVTFLGRALIGVVPIVGQVVIVLYTLADALGIFQNKAKDAAKDIEDGFITQKAVKLVQERVAAIKEEIANLRATPTNESGNSEFGPSKTEMDQRIQMLEDELQKMGDAAAKGGAELVQRAALALQNATDKSLATASQELVEKYRQTRLTLAEELKKTTPADKDDRAKINEARIENERTYYAGLIALTKQYLAEADQMTKSSDAATSASGKLLHDELVNSLLSLNQQAENADKVFNELPKTIDKAAKGISPIDREILNLQKTIAGWKAEITGAGEMQAKVNAILASPEFKNATEAQRQQLKDLAAEYDKTDQQKKDFVKAQHDKAQAFDELGKKTREVTDEVALAFAEFSKGGQTMDGGQLRAYAAAMDELGRKTGATAIELQKVKDTIASDIDSKRQAIELQNLVKLRDKTLALEADVQDTTDAMREKQFQTEVQRQLELLDRSNLTGQKRIEAEKTVQDYIAALRAKTDREEENSLQKLGRQQIDMQKQVSDVVVKSFDSMNSAIATFSTTGKLDFTSFVNSVIQDIIKLELKEAEAPIFKYLGDFIKASLGSSSGGPTGDEAGHLAGTSFVPDGAGGSVPALHSGGIVGHDVGDGLRQVSASLFASAKRFHLGGFPGLGSNEVPAILNRGEGVFTPAQMAALGNGAGGVAVQVNVINQSGQPLTAQQGTTRFDGAQVILDVVLKGASQPGPFRDGMKGALSTK